MEKFIPVDISCIFKLHEYPFDSQKCTIVLINKRMYNDTVHLVEDFVMYSGPPSISLYTIKKPEFRHVTDNSVVVDIEFEREMLNIFLTTILPSVLIVIVSKVSNTDILYICRFY